MLFQVETFWNALRTVKMEEPASYLGTVVLILVLVLLQIRMPAAAQRPTIAIRSHNDVHVLQAMEVSFVNIIFRRHVLSALTRNFIVKRNRRVFQVVPEETTTRSIATVDTPIPRVPLLDWIETIPQLNTVLMVEVYLGLHFAPTEVVVSRTWMMITWLIILDATTPWDTPEGIVSTWTEWSPH